LALLTIGQQLEEVQGAISAVMASQKYSIAGREQTRADLSSLTSREKELIARGEKYGFDVIMGQQTSTKAVYGVSFG